MKGVIFTFLLSYGGAVAALFNPFIGLLVYVCFAIIKPDIMWWYSLPQGHYSRIVALAVLAGWLVSGCGSWRLGTGAAILYALIAYWVWSALSAAATGNQDTAWIFVEELTKIILPFLVGITTINSIGQLRILAWVIVVSQAYLAFELNMSYFVDGYNRAQDVGFGMDNNFLACATNACIGLAIFLAMYSDRLWQKAAALIAAMLMAHVVLLTFSRGGMLGLGVTGIACFFLIPRKTSHYVFLILVVLMVLRLAGPEVRERFMSPFQSDAKFDPGGGGRLQLWGDCIDVAIKHPILGIGPRQWSTIAHTYGWTPGKEAHTLWLQVLAETGFLGLLFLALFYGLCIARLAQVARQPLDETDPWPRHLACMVIASLVGFAVSAQFVSILGLETPFYVTLVGACLLKIVSIGKEGASTYESPDFPAAQMAANLG